MFVHSERVPRLYKIASKCLREIIENGSSLKELVYNQKFPNLKALYALLAKSLQHFSEINQIVDKSQLLKNEPKFDPWLARVLVTQLFWSNKGLEGTCKPIATILSYRAALENHKLNKDDRTVSKVTKPRYVRVNTLAVSLDEAVSGFCDEGWELVQCTGKTYNDFIASVNALENHQFMVDVHIRELFVFPPKTEFYNHNAYKCKSIILQDKASCLPVHLLNPSPGSTVLDMCAAPGMKTSFLAAWLNNNGTIYAVENNSKRYNTLNTVIEGTYSTCIKTINKDVLLVTPEQCPNVEYILVDPSCSGSGITDRLTIDDEVEEVNQVRLSKLSYFQMLLLKHALKNFPQAKRVVYSTCSIYTEENEGVVDEVLKDNVNFKLVPVDTLLNFPFSKPKQLGDHLDYIRSCCVRTSPEGDLTNGFFIAVFERNENEVDVHEQTDVYEENLQLIQKAEDVKRKKKVKKTKSKERVSPELETIVQKKRKKGEISIEGMEKTVPDWNHSSHRVKQNKSKGDPDIAYDEYSTNISAIQSTNAQEKCKTKMKLEITGSEIGIETSAKKSKKKKKKISKESDDADIEEVMKTMVDDSKYRTEESRPKKKHTMEENINKSKKLTNDSSTNDTLCLLVHTKKKKRKYCVAENDAVVDDSDKVANEVTLPKKDKRKHKKEKAHLEMSENAVNELDSQSKRLKKKHHKLK